MSQWCPDGSAMRPGADGAAVAGALVCVETPFSSALQRATGRSVDLASPVTLDVVLADGAP